MQAFVLARCRQRGMLMGVIYQQRSNPYAYLDVGVLDTTVVDRCRHDVTVLWILFISISVRQPCEIIILSRTKRIRPGLGWRLERISYCKHTCCTFSDGIRPVTYAGRSARLWTPEFMTQEILYSTGTSWQYRLKCVKHSKLSG